jgi:hypothetical protein
MALQRQSCVNHPDRAAIGVCFVTKKPICAECSTRYEGVNYSKEALEILRQERAAAAKESGSRRGMLALLMICLSPLLLYAHYLFFNLASSMLIDIQQIDLVRWMGD